LGKKSASVHSQEKEKAQKSFFLAQKNIKLIFISLLGEMELKAF